MSPRIMLLLAMIGLGAGWSAAAQSVPDDQTSQSAAPEADDQNAGFGASDEDYILGPGDVVELRVLGRSDFTTRQKISQEGTINVPYLGRVTASNMNTLQLGDQLTKALESGGYYAKPILSVQIASYASRYVTILGEVGRPGLQPVDRPYHLSEILARVGGVHTSAADYVIVRPQKGEQHKYSVTQLIIGDPSQDPLVQPGDRIFVPKAEVFYISGQVKSPGAFPVESGMTLRTAIARAGGVTELGNGKGAKVTGKDGKLKHEKLDDPIAAGDIIIIPQKLF